MSIVIDQQYAGMVAPYVRNFKRTSKGVFNFSCPLCGDSQSNRSRARGYLYPAGDRLLYKCHKCGNDNNPSLIHLLKGVDKNLADRYVIDTFQEKKETVKKYEPVVRTSSFASKIDKSLIKVSTLPPQHRCKQYVVDRKIPSNLHYMLYYTDDYLDFMSKIDPKLELDVEYKRDPRLVIPLITETQEVAGYQGRALDANNLKYLTVLYNENNGKLFGLDRVDFNKKIYAFEGPLDAMFIPNGIATTGGRIDSIIEYQAINKSSTVICYDNEPRKKETVAKIQKALDNSFQICVWPESIKQKDINQMIVDGMSAQRVQQIIDDNTFEGLQGQLALQDWRRI